MKVIRGLYRGFYLHLTLVSLCVILILLTNFTPAISAQKDRIIVGFPSKLPTLDQYGSIDRMSIYIAQLMWDTPVIRDPQSGKIKPHLAQSWKIIEPTIWEFKLVPGVKFHNGNPLTAEAVRFTIEDRILAEKQKSPYRTGFTWLKKVEVLNDLTFRIITHKSYPLVLERLVALAVYDPKETKEKGDAWVAEHPMGTGPYKFVKWDRGSQLVMKANPNYWLKGLPKTGNLIIRILPEISTRLAELISGGIDVGLWFTSDQWNVLEKAKGVKPLDVKTMRINFWQFDSACRASKSPVQDLRVRRAIWHAIDREKIIKTVISGRAELLNTPVLPVQFGFDPSIKGYEYNPKKAKALLKEAGYQNGVTLNLWQYMDFQDQPNQAAMGYLEAVGIKIKLHDYRGNIGQLITLRNSGKVTDIGNFGWGSFGIFDADAVLPYFFMLDAPMCYNRDSMVDALLREARVSVDQSKRKELYEKAQKRIFDQAYCMPFFISHQIYGVNENVNLIVSSDEIPQLQSVHWK